MQYHHFLMIKTHYAGWGVIELTANINLNRENNVTGHRLRVMLVI